MPTLDTMARGLLRLRLPPLLRLMLSMPTTAMAILPMDTDMPTMDTMATLDTDMPTTDKM